MKNSGRSEWPVALTIAGSDSGGSAGIQADLKTFASLDVHGVTAITCVTAQNPKTVHSIHALPPAMVREQIDTVFAELPPAACKTGMLYSAAIIREVSTLLRERSIPLIVDPVMSATSGSRLLRSDALKEFKKLFRIATLITPNLLEAEALLARSIRSEKAMRDAARQLFTQFGCAALVKGGHLGRSRTAVDIFFDGNIEVVLSAPYIQGVRTHGTGCTLSAAIVAYLVRGSKLPDAVRLAKEYMNQSIAQRLRVGPHDLLNSFWRD
jgi:hydroxymethylpyrimidine/phosphomethylpyrimidine kinase